jgi:alcohol dehydrogenase (cytochrome c)
MYHDTGTDEVFAVDAATGAIRWTYTPPVDFLAGPQIMSAGPVSRVVGFVAAYDAATGRRPWRTSTVPAPGKGWNRARGAHGGGDVWMPPVVDPRTGTVYVSTGNPTPAFDDGERPGCNPRRDDR